MGPLPSFKLANFTYRNVPFGISDIGPKFEKIIEIRKPRIGKKVTEKGPGKMAKKSVFRL